VDQGGEECTALHCTALHCTALHCTALHCTALHCILQVRSDLPGYLADSEADGVCVINYYHKQFKHAAKTRSDGHCTAVYI
jgi:hypothetical protein